MYAEGFERSLVENVIHDALDSWNSSEIGLFLRVDDDVEEGLRAARDIDERYDVLSSLLISRITVDREPTSAVEK